MRDQNHLTKNFPTYHTESMTRNAHAQPSIIGTGDVNLLDLQEDSIDIILVECFGSNSGPPPGPKLLDGSPMNANGHYMNDPFDAESEIREIKFDMERMRAEMNRMDREIGTKINIL